MAKEAITGYTMVQVLLHIRQSGELHGSLALSNVSCQHTESRLGTDFGGLLLLLIFLMISYFMFERKFPEGQDWLQQVLWFVIKMDFDFLKVPV